MRKISMIEACDGKHADSEKAHTYNEGRPTKSNEKNHKTGQMQNYEWNHSHPINFFARCNQCILFF